MNITARKYILEIIFVVLLAMISLVTFNWLIDPYNLFGAPKISGVNSVKAVIGNKQRIYETVALLDGNFQTVILGTSRADIGIRPDHPAITARGFNGAMSGQPIWETRVLLEKVIASQHAVPRVVIIGLDFFAFNVLLPTPFDYSDENFHSHRRIELLFSLSTSLDALRTLIRQNYDVQLAKGGLIREDGLRDYVGNPKLNTPNRFRGTEEGFIRFTYKPIPECQWRSADIVKQKDSFADFSRILEIAHQYQIDLRLFISPSHARDMEVIAAIGLWEVFENWKRQLVELNFFEAQRFNKKQFPLWDFSGYNSITMEPVLSSNRLEPKYFWESSHYRKEVGNLVINRMFNFYDGTYIPPDDFGFQIFSNNIDYWLKNILAFREQYRIEQRADYEDVISMTANAKRSKACSIH